MTRAVPASATPRGHTVAIVGLGPKGLYCFERLLAEAHARPLSRPLHVRLFNRNADFGASPIYAPDQPEYILVNISVGEIDLWAADDPPVAAGRGLNFLDWYRETFRPQTPLTGDEYLSRAVVGRYLIEGFQRLLERLPHGVSVSRHVGEVVDIRRDGRGYRLEFEGASGAESFRADKVLLATGHSRVAPEEEEARCCRFAERHEQAIFIPFVYPVVETMGRVPAGAAVAMKGLGLTFIDALLELTEGRGGRFERTEGGGALRYMASGREPRVVYAFSRTGLPMTPKAHDLPPCARPLTFFTPRALAELRRAAPGGKLDFESDLWPLFELEMELQYYRALFGEGAERERLESCGDDARAMRRVVASFLRDHPEREPFDYRPVLDPVGERLFSSASEFDSFVERYMEREIERAHKGQSGCAVKAAVDIWYEVRTALGTVLQFGGLTPESHRKLIEHYYPLLKRVAFGPPIINIEKLLALQRAGLLDFSVARDPRVLTDDDEGRFELRCDHLPGAVARVEVLIDARYPHADVERDSTPLYRNLRRSGMVRAFENRSPRYGVSGYRPGAIDMTRVERFVIDGEGDAVEDISVIGIPTEGNLVGNLTLARDEFAGVWAAEVMRQLRRRERFRASAPAAEVA